MRVTSCVEVYVWVESRTTLEIKEIAINGDTNPLGIETRSILLTTSNFIGPWYHAALLFSGLGSIVLLFGVLFSQQIREDLVRAATSPFYPSVAVSVLLVDRNTV